MNTMIAERFNVAGALLSKLFGTFATDLRAYASHARQVRDTAVDRAMIGTVFVAALSLVGSLAVVAIYLFGGLSVIADGLTLGTVVALATLAQRIYAPVVDLASTRISLVQGLVAFERVYEVLDAPLAIEEAPNALSLNHVGGRVEL